MDYTTTVSRLSTASLINLRDSIVINYLYLITKVCPLAVGLSHIKITHFTVSSNSRLVKYIQ